MGSHVHLIVLVALVTLSLGIVLVGRRPLRRRWSRGAGWDEWCTVARTLSWRDRIHLERATSRGRAVRPGLAPLAVMRGRAAVAILERGQNLPTNNWAPPVMAVAGLLLIIGDAVNIAVGDGDRSTWFQLIGWTILTPQFATMRRRQHKQLQRGRRSIEVNLNPAQPATPIPRP